jgi:hypothetical protein
MKQFLITNPRYTGEAIAVYNDKGLLQKLDVSQTDMQPPAIDAFKKQVPVFAENLSKSFGPQTIIVGNDILISFMEFWEKYDHKFKKERAEQVWDRLSKSDRALAFDRLDKYHKHLRKIPDQAKLYPDTYLRSKAWLNDYK